MKSCNVGGIQSSLNSSIRQWLKEEYEKEQVETLMDEAEVNYRDGSWYLSIESKKIKDQQFFRAPIGRY